MEEDTMKQRNERAESQTMIVMASTTLAEALQALGPYFSSNGEASTVRTTGH
jgi:hypothetical protein